MALTLIYGLVLAGVQLILGLVLALASIYIGINLLDKLTKGIDEQKELKKGNAAVGILMAAVVLSIANVIQSGVAGLTVAMTTTSTIEGLIVGTIAGLVQVGIGIVLAVVGIYMAINVLDKITTDIDEMEELKKGNVAVAILMAGVLLAVSFVIQAGVSGIAHAIGVAL